MKKLLFMIISMAACLTMSGQQINQRLNDYRSNEILTKQRVDIDVVALLSRDHRDGSTDHFSAKALVK